LEKKFAIFVPEKIVIFCTGREKFCNFSHPQGKIFNFFSLSPFQPGLAPAMGERCFVLEFLIRKIERIFKLIKENFGKLQLVHKKLKFLERI
jgi:hypothetical protein